METIIFTQTINKLSMISKDYLLQIIAEQKEAIENRSNTMLRDSLEFTPEIKGFATIISGIKRCGKSTLLYQLLKANKMDALHLNFDDPRLFDFSISDFQKLDVIIKESKQKILMLDEIQIIKGWERYVRQKLNEGYIVYVTSSNASLLSKEIGTSLTGRHITTELFPFSYQEFCRYKKLNTGEDSLNEYLETGGFPEYVKSPLNIILCNLLDDILIRDISVRYGIKDSQALKRLAIYLLSNIGNLTSANKLREPCGIKSTTTILEYISHLELSYLISFVPMYDLSIKKQSINPKKIYAIDLGMIKANTSSQKQDVGHKLENAIYNRLRHDYKEIYYHKGKCECDFITVDKGEVNQAIQVCYELTSDNSQREINGLLETMTRFNLKQGIIITHHQEDSFIMQEGIIQVIPAYKFL